jgi:hypothetical protein
MSNLTNDSGLPLLAAVFLGFDEYQYEAGVISATKLIRPIRQTILAPRVPKEQRTSDVVGRYASSLGTAIHSGIEKAWDKGNYKPVMLRMGYPEHIVDRIKVNPNPAEVKPGDVPVYMENRMYHTHKGQIFSGQYDYVADGELTDVKSTMTFTWTSGNKDKDYQLQGSIYRWLDSKQPYPVITEDHIKVLFAFKDFMAGRAKTDKNYPPAPMAAKTIPLLDLNTTEQYIDSKLHQLNTLQQADESHLPLCTDEELWRRPSVYKVYKDPHNRKRCMAGGSFDNPRDAYVFLQEKTAGSGIVVEVPGTVMACNYCDAFDICTQKDDLIANGSLKIN